MSKVTLLTFFSCLLFASNALADTTSVTFQTYTKSGREYKGDDDVKVKNASSATNQAMGSALQKYCTAQASEEETCTPKIVDGDTNISINNGIGSIQCEKDDCCDCEEKDAISHVNLGEIEDLIDFILQ
ncbi:MAG: hypothetical protein H6619_03675 [Deltaproteobacteria bacterium]|nr:hypothetical protein [Deltaproteobacteria bacterium]